MNLFKQYINRIPIIIKNKYFLVFFSMIIWMGFIDSHNWIKQWKLVKKIDKLQDDKKYYQEEIYQDSIALHELTTNPKTQEKFAREKYLMKKNNEDIIVILNEDE